MLKPDLNCDLGEGEPLALTEALFRVVTSANVACGGHAGSLESMVQCVQFAREHGVHLGAHPGIPGAFGRSEVEFEPEELEILLLQQIGELDVIGRERGVKLHHIKLHGALYHMTDASEPLARVLVSVAQQFFPECCLYALAGGRVVRLAREHSVPVWEEGFLDRGYLPDGSLVPRGREGSLLSLAQVDERLGLWLETRQVLALDGSLITIQPETWCIHGDGPDALKVALAARRAFS